MKRIGLLGSTGSIGRQAADVVRRLKGKVVISALSAYSNLTVLKRQLSEFRPEVASVWEESRAEELKAWCRKQGIKTSIFYGLKGLVDAAKYSKTELVLSSVVGSIGLKPLMEAIKSGKDIALANKEALVIAGGIVMGEAAKRKVAVLPVDSEHSAIFQCLKDEKRNSVSRIFLTASGGPFYRSKKKHSNVTVKDALAHPTWDMGPKITVDSATLMNKGLEAIEAHHLFGVPLKDIRIIIHPQSVIHSMVEYKDSSVIAQLSNPDMRLPIQYALTYPERLPSGVPKLDPAVLGKLEFFEPDLGRFPCLGLALRAAEEGGTMPAAMNAANEVAVSLFLGERLSFAGIPKVIARTMSAHKLIRKPGLDDIFGVDGWARAQAAEFARKLWAQ
jgi:1-deoxy-D-xylulose-5-phosphate reductoisomerase